MEKYTIIKFNELNEQIWKWKGKWTSTSPQALVENLTISEQGAACRPRPLPNLASDCELNFLSDGNVKSTASPIFSLLPLHVDSPETSPQPTNHHSLPFELVHPLESSPCSSPRLLSTSILGRGGART